MKLDVVQVVPGSKIRLKPQGGWCKWQRDQINQDIILISSKIGDEFGWSKLIYDETFLSFWIRSSKQVDIPLSLFEYYFPKNIFYEDILFFDKSRTNI